MSHKDIAQSNKAISGKNAKNTLIKQFIPLLKKCGIITDYYKIKEPLPSLIKNLSRIPIIQFKNKEKWAIFTASGDLKDRVKEKYWEALCMKKYFHIKKCYIVITSDNDISKIISNYNKNINELLAYEKKENYFIDGIISQSDFFWLTLEKYLNKYSNDSAKGSKRGNAFEKFITEIINAPENIAKWNGTNNEPGFLYPLYDYIISYFFPGHPELLSISATTKIPPLANKIGKPKTDISIDITTKNHLTKRFNISCKASSKPSVSGHEYGVESFIKALNLDIIEDKNFIDALRIFQAKKSWKKIKEDPDLDYEEIIYAMENGFSERLQMLCEWVVTGKHGENTDPDIQIANYLLTINPAMNSNGNRIVCIESVDEYISQLLNDEKKHTGGIPFGWSHKKNKIQFKIPLFINKKRNAQSPPINLLEV